MCLDCEVLGFTSTRNRVLGLGRRTAAALAASYGRVVVIRGR